MKYFSILAYHLSIIIYEYFTTLFYDVSGIAFSSTEVGIEYWYSYIPSTILQRFSMVPTLGLLECWPKFINRSDLKIAIVSVPTKPNMPGKILVIFVFLSGGIATALICVILELWRNLIHHIKRVFHCLHKNRNLTFRCNSFTDKFHSNILIIVKSRSL